MIRLTSFFNMLRVVGVLAAAIALVGAHPAQAMRQQATVITAFYATTKTDYDKRVASASYIPVKYATLPSGTSYIGFAWFWNGAAKNGVYYVVLRHHKGSTINVVSSTFGVASGNSATWFYHHGTYANGIYDADLITNAVLAATTTVTIGGSGGGASGGAAVGGVTISTFISTTQASLVKWFKSPAVYPLPKAVTRFPAGTTTIGYCFIYKGAKAKITTHQVIVHGPHGLELKGSGPTVLTYASGAGGGYLSPPQQLAFPSATYTADFLINGKQAVQITFTVG